MTATGRKPDKRRKAARATPKARTTRTWARGRSLPADARTALSKLAEQGTVVRYRKNQVLFAQGDPSDAVFYVQTGEIKLTVVSSGGKSAVIAVLGVGDFFGHGCLTGQPLRLATALALGETSVVRIEKAPVTRLLAEDAAFSGVFVSYLLTRIIRIEEDLVDRLFNSSEKRLARVLLLLAAVGKQGGTDPVIPRVTQEHLAQLVGTTRARVSGFMNKFRTLGLIEYNGGLRVHEALLSVILHD